METDKYRALVTAIETGSLAAAAEKLGYTTSGISRMMASLENEMGMTLLDRSKSGVQASSSCEQVLPEIRALLRSAEVLNEKTAALHGTITGTVRVGTAYNYYFDGLSRAIRRFSTEYPDVSVELTGGFSSALARRLDAHELDLCIISRRDSSGKWIPLCRDEMVAAVSDRNFTAGKNNPPSEDRSSGDTMNRPSSQEKDSSGRKKKDSRTRAFPISGFAVNPYIQTHPDVDSDSSRILSKYGVIPNTKYTTEDSLATFSMVAAGLGVTMNNRINTLLWQGTGIAFLPLRPKQIIEIGIEVSNEADDAAMAFARVLMDYIGKDAITRQY